MKESIYKNKVFQMKSGERYCLIINKTTLLPEFYSNLFLTTQIRNLSNSFSTINSTASHLITLLRFLEFKEIDIEQRIKSKDFLQIHEIDSLADFFQKNLMKSQTNVVGVSTQYMRLTITANYLKWLSNNLIKKTNIMESQNIQKMVSQIKARRPRRRGLNQTEDKALTESQINKLFDVLAVNSDDNPFESIEIQKRNRLMVLMLYHLGIRKGELLNIRVIDIEFNMNYLKITRRSDENNDPRALEPNVKTLERLLPLNESLIKEIHSYVSESRRAVKNTHKHDFLFVTNKTGKSLGQPISITAFNKIFRVIKSSNIELSDVTAHTLRHTWNYNFSKLMDSKETPINEATQEKLRSNLMGWREGSGTAQHYNKRFIEQQAMKSSLQLQKGTIRDIKKNNGESDG